MGAMRGRGTERRGSVMMVITMAVTVLGTLSMAILASTGSSSRLTRQVRDETGSMYVAEAGLSEAVYALSQGGDGVLGTAAARLDFGGGEYWVEVQDLGDGVLSLVSTGVDGRAAARVQLVLQNAQPNPWSWGAFGDDGLQMDSNARVDSYDSSLGDYDSQVTGNGNDAHAGESGSVGSNQDVTLDSNTAVYGDASPGPAGVATVTGNAVVTGSTAPSVSEFELPTLEIPPVGSSGDWTLSGSSSDSFPAGEHGFDAFRLESSATLTLVGPAVLVCDSFVMDSNSEIIVDATNGPVEIYVRDDFLLNSNALISSLTNIPADVRISLESDNIIDLDDVDFDSNSKLYGVLFAPNAHVMINSNFELFGSLVARQVSLDSNSQIHFDEALLDLLLDDGEEVQYSQVCWRELPVSLNEIYQ